MPSSPEKKREKQRRYSQTPAGKATNRRYAESKKARQTKRRYNESDAARAAYRRWSTSAKGKAWRQARRARRYAEINNIKLSRGCVDCGYSGHPVALDFDHRDPASKRFDIGYATATSRSMAEVFAEIEKCDVRCANCHRVRSYIERHTGRSHERQIVSGQPTLFDLEVVG